MRIIFLIFSITLNVNVAFTQSNVYVPDPTIQASINHFYPGALVNDSVIADSIPVIKQIATSFWGNLADTTGLGHLDSLITLEFISAPTLSPFPILQLPNLISLVVSDPNMTTFPDLSGMPRLQSLLLFGAEIDSIGSIEHCDSLKRLWLPGSEIEFIASLSNCDQLRSLDLRSNFLKKAPDLDGLPLLKFLDLSNNPLTTHPNISNNTILDSLWLHNCQLTDAYDYQANRSLKHLRLTNNRLTDFPGVLSNDSLLVLELWRNPITTIPSFPIPMQLEVLSASSCNISNVGDLSKLTNLVSLALNRNQLTSLPDLTALTKLQWLSASYNQLTEWPKLNGNNQFNGIGLNNNLIATVPPIGVFYRTKSLDLSDNLLTEAPILTGSDSVHGLDLSNNFIRSIPEDYTNFWTLNIDLTGNKLDFSDAKEIREIDSTIYFLHPSISFGGGRPGPGLYFGQQRPFGDTMYLEAEATYNATIAVDTQKYAAVYKWYKDGYLLTETETPQLVLEYLQYDDAGMYNCVTEGSILTKTYTGDSAKTFISEPIYLNVIPSANPKSPLAVYPNPGRKDAIGIYLQVTKNDTPVDVSLINYEGKRIQLYTGNHSSGRHQLSLSDVELSAGVYVLEFSTPQTTVRKRMVIIE